MNKTTNKYSPEVRQRAVRMVLDNQGQHEIRWTAIVSISSKISDFTYVATWQGFAYVVFVIDVFARPAGSIGRGTSVMSA